MKTTQPIRKKAQLKAFVNYYLDLGKIRNYVLILMSCFTALRVSDLLRLKWDDVYDFKLGKVKSEIYIVETKTKKPKTIALHKKVVKALKMFAPGNAEEGKYIFENPRTGNAISRIQAYRLIRAVAEALEFSFRVSCHSLRKTFGYWAYRGGASLAIIMEIYNHSSIKVTLRYLGVTQDEINNVYLNINLI